MQGLAGFVWLSTRPFHLRGDKGLRTHHVSPDTCMLLCAQLGTHLRAKKKREEMSAYMRKAAAVKK